MDVYKVMLDLLQIFYDKGDVKMMEILCYMYQFLQKFCVGNFGNQVLLYKYLYFFFILGFLEVEIMQYIFLNNYQFCFEISEFVLQYFVYLLVMYGCYVQYLDFLYIVIKVEGKYVKKCQDMIMIELINVGDDVVVFYNDKVLLVYLLDMMKVVCDGVEDYSFFMYYIFLVDLLVVCVEGKNVYIEIKCIFLLLLEDVVFVVMYEDCIIEVKMVYVNFVNYCYVDMEVEMKEIYISNYIWMFFENFILDMVWVCSKCEKCVVDFILEKYVLSVVLDIINVFFSFLFFENSIFLQIYQMIVVQLLQFIIWFFECLWLQQQYKGFVEVCIWIFVMVVKGWVILLFMDLDVYISLMFSSGVSCVVVVQWNVFSYKVIMWVFFCVIFIVNQWDYKNIIEKLQDIIIVLEEWLKFLVQVELFVLVDVLYWFELFFLEGSEVYQCCESGGFLFKLIQYIKDFMELEEKLCIKVLWILQQMLFKKIKYGDWGNQLCKMLL